MSEITVHKLSAYHFMVECNGNPDFVYFSKHAEVQTKKDARKWTHIQDITNGTCCVGLWGPAAEKMMVDLEVNISRREGSISPVIIAGVPATAVRLSYVGECGWQIYAAADVGLSLWDALSVAGQSHGLVFAGRAAFSSLRIQSGFKFWGTDMTSEHSPADSGLDWAIDGCKASYVGAAALVSGREPYARRLERITIDDGHTVIMGKEPLFCSQNRVVGYVTSAAFAYDLRRPIAFAWIDRGIMKAEVEYFGRRIPITIMSDAGAQLSERRLMEKIEARL